MEPLFDDVKSPPAAGDDAPRRTVRIAAFDDDGFSEHEDIVAVERALEIHVAGAQPLITMRTPGADRELVAGLMHSEGVIRSRADIVYLKPAPGQPDVMRLMLKPDARARLDKVERNTLATSACGVCGKPSFTPPRGGATADAAAHAWLTPELLLALPGRMRADQGIFQSTGGLHAAGLFGQDGALCAIREDVGRHNALDKLIGQALLAGHLPLTRHILMLSGRASYELLQKAAAAGLPVVCAISAPSSYAIELARQFDITLVGFLRANRFNIYAGGRRLGQTPPDRNTGAIRGPIRP